MKVLMTGGGTAGHINPALAIAETVRQNAPGSEIEFVGIRGGKEADLVPREGYPLHFVESMGIRRSLSPANIRALWLAATSPYSRKTIGILDAFHPDIVIGTGGYACWPLMAAAARRGIPTAVHESNAQPGLAVKMLQKRVSRIWINFPQTADFLKRKDGVVRVGNPLRNGFGLLSREEARRRLRLKPEQLLILSFGGSLGAENVNRAVLTLMRDYSIKHPEVVHLHATGKRDFSELKDLFRQWGLERYPNCILCDYIYDMPIQMAAADVVISRAGAMTLSELALMRKACILIPSPYVADNHQYRNAEALSGAGAAILTEEKELSSGALTATVAGLLSDRGKMETMRRNIAGFADPEANRRVWQQIQELTGNQS